MKIKKANGFIFFLLRCFFRPFLRLKFRFRFDRSTSKKIKGPCFILANHQMAADQFLVASGFKFAINFVASDYLMRRGFASTMIRLLARPIPIVKGGSDFSAVKNILSVFKQGGSVALFPEGNRTFYGETSYFKPAIGKLAKKAKVKLVLINIKGGFLTAPRWGNGVRKGRSTASVVKVLTPEEMELLSDEKINEIIAENLYINDYDYAKSENLRFKSKKRAEYIESVLFGCPECGDFESLKSDKNRLYCTKCGLETTYGKNGLFENSNRDCVPSEPLAWSKLQLDMLTKRDYSGYTEKPVFSDERVSLYLVKRAISESLVGVGGMKMFCDRIEVCGQAFSLSSITHISVQGIRVLQIYLANGEYYMVRIEKAVNPMKYMILYYHLREKREGETESNYGY